MRVFRSYILFAVITCIILLVVIRVIGNQKFTVVATPSPETIINTQTPLFQGIQQQLAKQLDHQRTSASSFFYPLGNPYHALLSRILLADHASQSLDVQYYLFHDDAAGRALLAALLEAAKRGVKVRLLIDDMDTKGRDELFISLTEETKNLQIRVFNPSWLRQIRTPEYLARFPRVTRRMHNKSYTADNIASVVGGRNIGDEYFNLSAEVNFNDFDILAAGKIASEVVNEFNVYWYSGLAVDIQSLNNAAENEHYDQWKTDLQDALQSYRDRLQAKAQNLAINKVLEGSLQPYFDDGRVIFDPPDKVVTSLFDQGENMAPLILGLMKKAQKDLLISSPYFIPGETGLSLFSELRERGVNITILTNALKANDVGMVHAGYMDYRKKLLAMGVEIFELKPQLENEKEWSLTGSKRASLHAKMFIVDHHQLFVGSFNLDPRSALHNTEMGIVFDSAEYAAEIYQRADKNLPLRAYRVSVNDEQSLVWKETLSNNKQRIHNVEPGTNWWERTSMYLLSWLPVEWLL